MSIIRIQNPAALQHPAVLEVFFKSFRETYDNEGAAAAVEALARRIEDPRLGAFVGEEGGQFLACVIVLPPSHDKYSAPQVTSLYNAGSGALRDAIVTQAVEFMKQNGYNRFWCVNQTGKPDEVYSRFLKIVGDAKPVGTILEYRLAA